MARLYSLTICFWIEGSALLLVLGDEIEKSERRFYEKSASFISEMLLLLP